MASTSSMSAVTKEDSQVLSPILERLGEEVRQRLEPFISEIEEHIQRTVSMVRPEKLKRRSKEGVLSAAIYDTFLIFEKRTKVRIRNKFIAECLGVQMFVVNQNWRDLFDDRVKIERHRIVSVFGSSDDPVKLISEVVQVFLDALVEKIPRVEEWFALVEEEAKDLLKCLDRKRIMDYPPEVVAATAVYSVIQCEGKPMVQLSQRDASLTCSFSQAMVNKVWLELFNGGEYDGG